MVAPASLTYFCWFFRLGSCIIIVNYLKALHEILTGTIV